MPYHGIPPTDDTTPTPSSGDQADQHTIDYLLAALDRIPRSELPDGLDRNALAMLIRAGFVDNLYQPFGCDYHNIAWRRAPWVDPRERVSHWLAARRDVDRGSCDLPGKAGTQ